MAWDKGTDQASTVIVSWNVTNQLSGVKHSPN